MSGVRVEGNWTRHDGSVACEWGLPGPGAWRRGACVWTPGTGRRGGRQPRDGSGGWVEAIVECCRGDRTPELRRSCGRAHRHQCPSCVGARPVARWRSELLPRERRAGVPKAQSDRALPKSVPSVEVSSIEAHPKLVRPHFRPRAASRGPVFRLRNGPAQSDLARSRSRNFWIFPVDVFGSRPNTTVRGAL